MSFRYQFKKLMWRAGYDISRFTPNENALARRRELFELFNIDLVLDVGANTGQFGRELRDALNYQGRIISFEPMKQEFAELEAKASSDNLWEVRNFALGDTDETTTINIAGNSLSSSLLEMKQQHIDAAPDSKYVGHEEIQVYRLDSIFNEIHKGENNIFLKIDTQGFEMHVLRGASSVMDKINTVQLEMSLVPMYETDMLFPEMTVMMAEKGFYLAALNEVFSSPKTGRLLQVDGLFHKGSGHE